MRRNVRWLSRKNNALVQRRGLLQIVNKYARVPPIAWMVGLTLALAPWYLLPQVKFFVEPANYVPVHTLLELLATAVALMVITLAWNLRTEQHNRRLALLGAGFLAVALTDVGHTMSYVSMPDFITPNSTNKAIFFGLSTRYIAAITTLCTALLRPKHWSQRKCSATFLVALSIVAVLFWIGLFHYDAIPVLHVPGLGQTAFKLYAEYVGVLLYAVATCVLIFNGCRQRNVDQLWLAAASWTLGLSELCFTLYVDFTDLSNLIGHLYKVVAYAMIYRALFVAGVRAPYRELARERSSLQALLAAIPDPVWMKSAEGIYLACNNAFAQLAGRAQADVISLSDNDIFTAELADSFRKYDRIALNKGGRNTNEEWLQLGNGEWHLFETSKIPTYLPDGSLEGILGVAHDITVRKRVEDELRLAAITFESQEGILIADANEVILRVNRALTKITGYSAEEVIGKTPRMLESGQHDEAFYAAMTRTLLDTDSWQGETWNRRKNGEIYPAWMTITTVKQGSDEQTYYVAHLTDITERKAAAEQIQYLSLYDTLTQLPNRKLMISRLENAVSESIQQGIQGALLLIDLDGFKTLNDTAGHEVGDQLLVAMGARLRQYVSLSDNAARIGGDEFAVILEGLASGEAGAVQAEARASEILAHLGKPYPLQQRSGGQQSYQCTLSIGIALFGPALDSVEELLKRADTAMHQAKAAGRNRLCFFDPAMQAAVIAHATLEAELRRAIAADQLVLHYQPQVESTGNAIGAEALIRWQHPEQGMILPGSFIPLAEETGLIVPIGQWVLKSACEQLARWATQPALAHLSLAINVSALQFAQADFVENVVALIRQTGAPAHKLKLELTESLLAHNTEIVVGKMLALTMAGVRFALDDFGTGYSSLSYLKRLPLHQLKIDRSFVRDVASDAHDAAIIKTIIALGQTLGLAVIAEGVETAAQRDFLRENGCSEFQGYLFGKPLSIAQFEQRARQVQLAEKKLSSG